MKVVHVNSHIELNSLLLDLQIILRMDLMSRWEERVSFVIKNQTP